MKLNCSVPGAPIQPPERFGGRSSTDWHETTSATPTRARWTQDTHTAIRRSWSNRASSCERRSLEATQRRLLADDRQQLVHGLRHRPPGQRDSNRLKDLTRRHVALLREIAQHLLQTLRRPVGRVLQCNDARGERSMIAGGVLGNFPLGLLVQGQELPVQPHRHLPGHIERSARARFHRGNGAQCRISRAIETELRQLRLHEWIQLLRRLRGEVLPIHPLELCRIKDGRLLENAVERKEASQLLFAHDLAIAARAPYKKREEV